MPRRRKRKETPDDPLEVYRRVRKPMPPPDRVIPDRRRERTERIDEREARDESDQREQP